MQNKITPFLWFDNNCEEAINFYTSVFKNSSIKDVRRYPEGGPMPAGTFLTGTFNLDGQDFMALNAGPQFKFNEAVSFFVNCKDQEEVDYYWNKLTAEGGEESMCGWLKDKFGLSWQIIPEALGRLLSDPDPKRANNAMQAMLKMRKIIVKDLEAAAQKA